MGQSISAIRKEAKAADQKDMLAKEERLNVLEKMLHARVENAMSKILNGEHNDQEIDTGTIVEEHKRAYVTDSSKESDELRQVIGEFFHGKWLQALETTVQLGAEAVLGNNKMGEFEKNDLFILWDSNSLLRYDVYYYRWNFSAKGVIDEYQGVLAFFLVKRVIDITKVNPQILTWAISTQAARQPNLKPGEEEKEIDSAMKILEKVIKFQQQLKKEEAGVTEK